MIERRGEQARPKPRGRQACPYVIGFGRGHFTIISLEMRMIFHKKHNTLKTIP